MKLLVFAHIPPPRHGQSYMVQMLLEVLHFERNGLRRTHSSEPLDPIECFHVDSRLSRNTEDIGAARWGKVPRLLQYCVQALWLRFRFGADHFYYIPAFPSRAALYRDWIVMAICRPFFHKRIYHWQACGLAEWLTNSASRWEKAVSSFLLGRPDLSIVLSEFNRCDAQFFESRSTVVVPNATDDPCPDFAARVLPYRHSRSQARRHWLQSAKTKPALASPAAEFRVLYLSLCSRSKGLFDAVEAIAIANRQSDTIRFRLTVAGSFWLATERAEFDARILKGDLNQYGPAVQYVGFVSGEQKNRLFLESDCFCFPTWYEAESFGIVLAEAMLWGLPIVTTRWRMIPELLPAGYPGLVDPRSPEQLAASLLARSSQIPGEELRRWALDRYLRKSWAEQMRRALLAMADEPGR